MNSTWGSVKNNHTLGDDVLSAGGSSGGSAVAVATGQCDAYVQEHKGAKRRLTVLGPWVQIQEALYVFRLRILVFWVSSPPMA